MKKFQKKVEDFECEKCGTSVTGNGYTNHCPACLHSKHVDIMPGDRAEKCHGLMIPKDYDVKSGSIILTQECTKCAVKKKIKIHRSDNVEILYELSKKRAAQ